MGTQMNFTESGDVQLVNGRIIKDGDTKNLSKEEMLELYDTPASMFQILSIKTNQSDMKKSMDHLIEKIDKKFIDNTEAIEEIVEDKMGSIVKEKVLSTASIMKALTVIIGFFGALGLVVYAVIQTVNKIGG
jgi:hypothetical protein